jgi:Flp pilus assembly protein TadG
MGARIVAATRRLSSARGEEGVSTVLFALILPVLIGMQALTVDATQMFAERRDLQNAADAAALAAAVYLPSTDPAVLTRAVDAAIEYAALNGVTIQPSDVVFSTDVEPNDRVTVNTQSTVSFFFAPVLGPTVGAVGSYGTGQIGVLGGRRGVMPFAVEEQPGGFDYGETFCLKYGSGGGSGNPCRNAAQGNYLALDIDDTGNDSAEVYRTKIVTGSDTIVYAGDTKNIARGNMQGPTMQGTGCQGNDGRISGNTTTFDEVVVENADGTYTVLDWTNPRLVVIPVVDVLSADNVEVLGFAAFFIEQCGSNGSVLGRFIDTVVPGGVWMPFDDSFGSRVVRLVE